MGPRLKRFFDARAQCFADHVPARKPLLETPPGWPFWTPRSQKFSLHGNALACIANVGTAAQRQSAARYLAGRLAGKLGPNEYVGPGWIEMICAPLCNGQHDRVANEYIRKIYGDALDQGVVAWPEHWNDQRHFSHNTGHGWGAAVNTWLVERVVGLRPIKPGWKTVLFDPRPHLVSGLHYSINLPIGRISVEFNKGTVYSSFPRGTSFVRGGREHRGTGATQKILS